MAARRQRMLEDLGIRNFAPPPYIRAVAEFARYFNKPIQLDSDRGSCSCLTKGEGIAAPPDRPPARHLVLI